MTWNCNQVTINPFRGPNKFRTQVNIPPSAQPLIVAISAAAIPIGMNQHIAVIKAKIIAIQPAVESDGNV